MATESKAVTATNDVHVCDWCSKNFACDTHYVGNLGFSACHCLQLIVSEEKKDTRLAFWCSDDCFDEDNPEPESEQDEEDEGFIDFYLDELGLDIDD